MKGRKRMNIRDDKGITLAVEIITVLLLVLIVSVISYSSMSSLQVKTLNNMYSDIISVQEKATNYYFKYGRAPVTAEAVSAEIVNKIADEKNPNDEPGEYYKINFNALNNLSLNNKQTEDSFYFMNAKTLTVYHSLGVKVDGLNNGTETKHYHTLPSNYQGISKLNVNYYQD